MLKIGIQNVWKTRARLPILIVLLLAGSLVAGCRTIQDFDYVHADSLDKDGHHEDATRYYQAVADSEDYEHRQAAQFELAERYLEGKGTPKSPSKAIEFYEDVLDGPDKTWIVLAASKLGFLHDEGIGDALKRDRVKSIQYYQIAANLDDEIAIRNVKDLSDYPEVFFHLNESEFVASDNEIAPAGMATGYSFFSQGSNEEAYEIFLWHARHGNEEAQANVAVMLRRGLGVIKDMRRYAAWTYLSARNGNAAAQFSMGELFRTGELFLGSDEEALFWYGLAESQNDAEAINSIGVIYANPIDKGVSSDHRKAAKQFERAAELGSTNGMVNLGDIYYAGLGRKQDQEKAQSLYKLAAEAGNVGARLKLFEYFSIVFDESIEDEKTAPPPMNVAADSPNEPKPTGRLAEETAGSVQSTRTGAAAAAPKAMTPVELYAAVSPSVFMVVALSTTDESAVSQGSAVAITEDLALTNCHVLAGMNVVGAIFNEDPIEFNLVAANTDTDVCVLSSPVTLDPIDQFRSFSSLHIGERVFAIGSPLALTNSLSDGLVSGLRHGPEAKLIQTSAAISSGSSGGGLFDEQGRLVGVTTFTYEDSENLNFAVSVDTALALLKEIAVAPDSHF